MQTTIKTMSIRIQCIRSILIPNQENHCSPCSKGHSKTLSYLQYHIFSSLLIPHISYAPHTCKTFPRVINNYLALRLLSRVIRKFGAFIFISLWITQKFAHICTHDFSHWLISKTTLSWISPCQGSLKGKDLECI